MFTGDNFVPVGAISPTSGSGPNSYAHRRSLAGLTGRLPLSAFTNASRFHGTGGWSCSLNRRRNLSKPETQQTSTAATTAAATTSATTTQRPFFFSSWRRSYSTSKGSKRFCSPTSGIGKKRSGDVKSMENLLTSSSVDNEDNVKMATTTRQFETTMPFDC